MNPEFLTFTDIQFMGHSSLLLLGPHVYRSSHQILCFLSFKFAFPCLWVYYSLLLTLGDAITERIRKELHSFSSSPQKSQIRKGGWLELPKPVLELVFTLVISTFYRRKQLRVEFILLKTINFSRPLSRGCRPQSVFVPCSPCISSKAIFLFLLHLKNSQRATYLVSAEQ